MGENQKPRRKERHGLMAFLLISGVVALVWPASISTHHPTMQADASQLHEQPTKQITATIIEIVGAWTDRNKDGVNAFSAMFVALFTFTLWRATVLLFKAGEAQRVLSEKAFEAQTASTNDSLKLAKASADAAKKAADAAAATALALGKQADTAAKMAELAEIQKELAASQHDLAMKQHGLERARLVAENRPRLRIRSIVISAPDLGEGKRGPIFEQGRRIAGSLVVVNAGDTQATIIAGMYRFYWDMVGLPAEPPFGDQMAVMSLFGHANDPLEGKASRLLPLGGSAIMDHRAKSILDGYCPFYIFGVIRYADTSFPPKERFMGFCRQYVLPKLVGGEGRFRAVADEPDYEFED